MQCYTILGTYLLFLIPSNANWPPLGQWFAVDCTSTLFLIHTLKQLPLPIQPVLRKFFFIFIVLDIEPCAKDTEVSNKQPVSVVPSGGSGSRCKRGFVNSAPLCASHFWPCGSLSTSPFLHPLRPFSLYSPMLITCTETEKHCFLAVNYIFLVQHDALFWSFDSMR